MKFFKRILKRSLPTKQNFIYLAITLLFLSATIIAMVSQIKQVRVYDEGKIITVKTLKKNVNDILKDSKIVYGEFDLITPSLNEKVYKNGEITIKRAKNIRIVVDGQALVTKSHSDTVELALKSQNITVSSTDELNYSLSDKIFDGMTISISRYFESVVAVNEKIPFKTQKQINTNLNNGITKVAKDGIEGVMEKKYKIVTKNGVEISRQLIAETIVKKPIDKVVEYGVRLYAMSSRGDTIRFKKVISTTATAYDLSYASCGKRPGDKNYGKTATGMQAKYGVVAVDPSVIPLHSRLYIEGDNGSWSYGYAVAGDTGGAIKGNKIDLFFNTADEVRKFGRRQAKVYILE